MNENQQLPDVVMPRPPHRNLLRGQNALVTGANSGSGQRRTAVEHADVIQAEETALKHVVLIGILAIDPPSVGGCVHHL
ncbi:MAG: hypothetical protein Q7S71_05350 [Candidatus Nitrotoga sp.]|nr:hypothetical protein [Candidatus Nitrotoga sp.]